MVAWLTPNERGRQSTKEVLSMARCVMDGAAFYVGWFCQKHTRKVRVTNLKPGARSLEPEIENPKFHLSSSKKL